MMQAGSEPSQAATEHLSERANVRARHYDAVEIGKRKEVAMRLTHLVAAAAIVLLLAVMVGPAIGHHNPRLFTNSRGDHGGTYPNQGRHTFFWLAKKKRFDYVRVCIWRYQGGNRACKRFKVRRVPAASYRPWGVDFRTGRHFDLSRGRWSLRFWHGKNTLSPVLGFHRR
jgi:hypothetical protein